jgi:hypothetical protein
VLTITVDNRIRIRAADVPLELATALREEFTHPNPDQRNIASLEQLVQRLRNGKKDDRKRAGRYMGMLAIAKKAPKTICTWAHEKGALTFPRGGMQRVRDRLGEAGIEFEVIDARTEGSKALARELKHSRALYDFQEEIVEVGITRENCLARSPTGCLAGDSIIGVNRAGKSFQIEISELVRRHEGGLTKSRTWDREIPTTVRARCADGTIRLCRLVDAYVSGEKQVYEVVTSSGRKLRATAEHRFLTPKGWRVLGGLHVGDLLFCEARTRRHGVRPKTWYRLVSGLKSHPYAGRLGVKPGKGGTSVPMHRLVVEAVLNGCDYESFIAELRSGEIPRHWTFLDPSKWIVHHRDENPRNNTLENLVVMTDGEHKQEHAAANTVNVLPRTVEEEIVAISKCGVEMTYDLSLESPHNFLANGIVVHNSGKTTAALAYAAATGLATLVIVANQHLLDQWIERCELELGMNRKDVGIIGGSKFKLGAMTIAMQQSLAKLFEREDDPRREEVLSSFGTVIADEVHLFAAKTFLAVIDRIPARYRLGVSADERRKDKKQFLLYDVFGPVAVDVKESELVERKIILDVEVRVVPTGFDMPWYQETPETERGMVFDRVLDGLTASAERNTIIHRIAAEECDAEQILVFSHRVEHCQRLEADFRCDYSDHTNTGLLLGGDLQATEFKRTVKGLRAKTVSVAYGTYQAIAASLDFPSIAVGIATTPIHNNPQTIRQVKGRLCRTAAGKGEARLYALWDEAIQGRRFLRNLIVRARRVLVRVGEEWVDGRAHLARLDEEARKHDTTTGTGDLFQ